jgi:hypothetical protein
MLLCMFGLSGTVIDAVLVAMAMLKTRVKKLKFAKRIFLITDAAGAIGDDPAQTETIAGVMLEDGSCCSLPLLSSPFPAVRKLTVTPAF